MFDREMVFFKPIELKNLIKKKKKKKKYSSKGEKTFEKRIDVKIWP